MRMMLPEKPFMLVRVTVEVALVPMGDTMSIGFAIMLKSVT